MHDLVQLDIGSDDDAVLHHLRHLADEIFNLLGFFDNETIDSHKRTISL